jgi:hypothetical protein
VLEATVLELYGDFQELRGAPGAVMTVRFSVIDEGSPRPKVIYDRSVSQRVSVPSSSPDALVIGYGAALSAALKQFTTDISQLPPQ